MMNIQKCANIDFLTQLYNRSYILDLIAKLIEKNEKFSIFYIDLNKFKIVNDVYGHDVGDRVLKEVPNKFDDILSNGSKIGRKDNKIRIIK